MTAVKTGMANISCAAKADKYILSMAFLILVLLILAYIYCFYFFLCSFTTYMKPHSEIDYNAFSDIK